jgi:hypothetical protein
MFNFFRQQMQMNFIPDIKSHTEVYDIGCICEVKIREQKEFGVSSKHFNYIFINFLIK